MASVWTQGKWTVKPGREQEFVELWSGLRDFGTNLGGGSPFLLRDREQPNIFYSFGPWPDLQSVDRFRSSDAFSSTADAMRDVLEAYEVHTLDEVIAPD